MAQSEEQLDAAQRAPRRFAGDSAHCGLTADGGKGRLGVNIASELRVRPLMGLRRFFQIEARGTTLRREILAGITTFTTMSYIIVVNPAILKTAGIPEAPSMTATILAAVCGCLLMGLYANRPFAIAPYMGENAFIAFTVCLGLGVRWQTALGAIFVAGVAFVLLTVLRLRQWLVESIPTSLRYSFAVGIGLFLTFIGLNQTGIVELGVAGAPVKAGALTAAPVLVAIFGFLLISALVIRKIPGAILIGIVLTALVAFVSQVAPWPSAIFGAPVSIAPIFAQIDLRGALSPKALPVALTIFIMAFVDTMGTLIGLSARAGFLDEHGNLPQIERPMMADARGHRARAAVRHHHLGRVCGIGYRN